MFTTFRFIDLSSLENLCYFSLKAQSSGNGPSHGGSISEFLTKLATGDDYGHSVAPVVQAPVVTPYAAQIFPPPVEQDQAWYVLTTTKRF